MGTKLRSLIVFLHYFYHSKKALFFLTLFPFPFTCSSQLTMAIAVQLGSNFILYLKFLHQFSDSKTHDTSSESEKIVHISITKTRNNQKAK